MANTLNKVNSGGIEDGSIVNADVKSDAAIAGSKLAAATTSAAGSMSAADKTKLDGVATSATANPSAPALTGSTNNTVCTVTGANAIQGEANLTFDGSTLTHNQTGNNATPKFLIAGSGNDAGDQFQINNYGDGNGDYYGIGVNQGLNASGNWAKDSDTARSAGVILDSRLGRMAVYVSHDGAGQAVRSHSEFDRDGHLKIEDGNLIIGTAGHGIDFSANSHAGGMTSELLDSYEEGTWTPTLGSVGGSAAGNGTYDVQSGTYTKVGNIVSVQCYLNWNNDWDGASGSFAIPLPFTSNNSPAAYGGVYIGFLSHTNGSIVSANSSVGGYLSGGNVLFYQIPHGTQSGSNSGGTINNASWSEGAGYVQFNTTYKV